MINTVSFRRLVMLLVFLVPSALAKTLVVPVKYATIQAAVDFAGPGDTVYVLNGTYHGAVRFKDHLWIIGQDSLRTIIDGGGFNGEGVDVHIERFKFTHCSSAVYDYDNTYRPNDKKLGLWIRNNVIEDCKYAGISLNWNAGGEPVIIENNIIKRCPVAITMTRAETTVVVRNNFIYWCNLGMDFNTYSMPKVYNNLVTGCNTIGIQIEAGKGSIINNTIVYNGGAGIYVTHNPTIIRNNIICFNQMGIRDYYSGAVSEYNNIYGNGTNYGLTPGKYDLSCDPLFTDTVQYALRSASLCIDAGDPRSACDNEPSYNGRRIDLGAHGNSMRATRSDPHLALRDTVNLGARTVSYAGLYAVSVRNTGTTVLNLDSIRLRGDGFTLSSATSGRVPPNDSISVIVKFFPQQAVPYAAELTLISNDERMPRAQMMLFGQGTPPRPDSLQPIVPAGGEVWQFLTRHTLAWSTNVAGNFKIDFSADNGETWRVLSDSVAGSARYFTFTVPSIAPSDSCVIRFTSLGAPLVVVSKRFSVVADSVRGLTLIAPYGASRCNAGGIQQILWTYTGGISTVKLEYTNDNGSHWAPIADSVPAAIRSYRWIVPLSPSASCRIRITNRDDQSVRDVSDSLFTITRFDLTNAKGGEAWLAGSSQNIFWSSQYVGKIGLFFSFNNGATWAMMGSPVEAATGMYTWMVPYAVSDSCRIKVQEYPSGAPLAMSDSCFSIWQPIVVARTPGSGHVVQSFGAAKVSLVADVTRPTEVSVTYFPLKAPSPGRLPSSVASVKPLSWYITSYSMEFSNGKICVPLSVIPKIGDARKVVWLRRYQSGEPWANLGGVIVDGELASEVEFHYFGEFAIGVSSPPVISLSGAAVVIDQTGRGLAVDSTLTIANNGADTLVVDSIYTRTPMFSVGRTSARLTNKDTLRVSITMHPLAIGNHADTLYILNNSTVPLVKVPILGTVITGILSDDVARPLRFALAQNYPNPFNPSTTISFSLPSRSFVTLKIFDVMGRHVATVVSDEMQAGNYSRQWNASGMPSGVYFYRLHAGGYTETKRLILLR